MKHVLRMLPRFAAALVSVVLGCDAFAQCPDWTLGFAGPGTNAAVTALAVHDDGSGSNLYAGGDFTQAGERSVSHIAQWDGTAWAPLGAGLNAAPYAMTSFDDGSGPALFVGGTFGSAGGQDIAWIAKWDGSSWSAVGGSASGIVFALTVFDDGTGPALYAAGDFSSIGSVTANRIAKWNGTTWSPLGAGIDGPVFALTVWDDGGGAALYAGGFFQNAGGTSTRTIAKWDGATWSPLGTGTSNFVGALVGFDDGSGPALYAGGGFFEAGGVAAHNIARWNGSSWAPVGAGFFGGTVGVLTIHDEGLGPRLFAGGQFSVSGGGCNASNAVAQWNGSTWSHAGAHFGGGTNTSSVLAMVVHDDGSGPALYAGGPFPELYNCVGGFLELGFLARSRTGAWEGVGPSHAIDPGGSAVQGLVSFDDGTGTALYVAGTMSKAGGVAAKNVARWDGSVWSALGAGVTGFYSGTYTKALVVFDDGTGPALYVGGFFDTAGAAPASSIAKWNGSSWSALGAGITKSGAPGHVRAVAVFDDGTGPALYVGGLFDHAGGIAAMNLARWDGTAWSAVGGGVTVLPSAQYAGVQTLLVFDDGSGPALFVGGTFTEAGGAPIVNPARWDGTAWSGVGGGVGYSGGTVVMSMTPFDDGYGAGPELYVAGLFTIAGGNEVHGIARWDGAAWSDVGGGLTFGTGNQSPTFALSVFDDGTGPGPALYAGGGFRFAGGMPVNQVARWNGASWSAVGDGVDNLTLSVTTVVAALGAFGPFGGGGPALYAGGNFTVASGKLSTRIARLQATCAGTGQPFCAGDGVDVLVTTACPCDNRGDAGRGCGNSADAAGGWLQSSGSALADATTGTDTIVLSASGLPASATTIFLQGTSALTGGLVFGDGVRCVGGLLVRLGVKQAVSGSAQYPELGDLSVSQRGGVAIGSAASRAYQAYYRDPSAAFCPPATFNITNGIRILW